MSSSQSSSLFITDPPPGAVAYPLAGNPAGTTHYQASASGGFKQDGYADLVVLMGTHAVGYLPSALSILAAKDPRRHPRVSLPYTLYSEILDCSRQFEVIGSSHV